MSTAIEVRFVAGRYHAQPWNRQVNEADVEWPPSPLRLLRAFIATWHRKADRNRYGESHLRSLIHELAAELPVYSLPSSSLSHVRHYMPVRSGRKEKKTLVFDAFLSVDPTDPLTVVWPGLELTQESTELLDHLLERIGYLGRAESWASLRRVERWSALPDSGPEASFDRWDAGGGGPVEPVELPIPLETEEYSRWRVEQIDDLGLADARLVREKKLAATLPDDLLDALRMDTGQWRDVGWSRMPGTDLVTYLRPEGCFSVSRSRRGVRRRATPRPVTTVRLALIEKPGRSKNGASAGVSPLPLLEDALRIGEVARLAALHAADADSSVLSGHDMPDDAVHDHAFYLPEDSDGDGRIDHVLIHAAAGLEPAALDALGRIERLWVDRGSEWNVILESYGSVEDFGDHPYLVAARTWVSATPYLHPWFRKKSFTVADQILKELALREVVEPAVEQREHLAIRGRKRRPVHFHRFRRRPGLTQPDTKGSFWRLEFPEPVPGPIALGFGCHYGLGVFQRG